jgi:hypothetical protein
MHGIAQELAHLIRGETQVGDAQPSNWPARSRPTGRGMSARLMNTRCSWGQVFDQESQAVKIGESRGVYVIQTSRSGGATGGPVDQVCQEASRVLG